MGVSRPVLENVDVQQLQENRRVVIERVKEMGGKYRTEEDWETGEATEIIELEGLDINDDMLEDIHFAHLTDLKELDLSGNQIVHVTPLATLTGLKHLSLQNNQIVDFGPLKSLVQLTTIGLRYNQKVDVCALEYLTHLKQLYLQ